MIRLLFFKNKSLPSHWLAHNVSDVFFAAPSSEDCCLVPFFLESLKQQQTICLKAETRGDVDCQQTLAKAPLSKSVFMKAG